MMCGLGRVSSLSLPRSEEDAERGYHHWGEEGKSGVGEEEKAREGQRKAGFDASDATKKKEGRL